MNIKCFDCNSLPNKDVIQFTLSESFCECVCGRFTYEKVKFFDYERYCYRGCLNDDCSTYFKLITVYFISGNIKTGLYVNDLYFVINKLDFKLLSKEDIIKNIINTINVQILK